MICFCNLKTVSAKLVTSSAYKSAYRSHVSFETKIPFTHLCCKYLTRSLMKILNIFGLAVQPCRVPT